MSIMNFGESEFQTSTTNFLEFEMVGRGMTRSGVAIVITGVALAIYRRTQRSSEMIPEVVVMNRSAHFPIGLCRYLFTSKNRQRVRS